LHWPLLAVVSVQPVERKLAAIFAADIAGYGRLIAITNGRCGASLQAQPCSSWGLPGEPAGL